MGGDRGLLGDCARTWVRGRELVNPGEGSQRGEKSRGARALEGKAHLTSRRIGGSLEAGTKRGDGAGEPQAGTPSVSGSQTEIP